MKIKALIFLFLINHLGFSQSKEFTFLDHNSKKPIDLVQVFYPDLEIGSVSNKDGKIRIPLRENKIIVSHINYTEKEFSFNDFKIKDTIYLIQKKNQLDQVVLYNLDLKQKFIDILDSYKKKYSTRKVIHNSTYKETHSLNDSLTRLFQVQLDWYSKYSLFLTDKAINKQNIINLESVDYSKIKKIKSAFVDSNGGYVDNESFFRFLHLNYLLQILIHLTDDYEIESIEKNQNTISVYFNATLKEKGKEVFKYKKSLIVFDKDYTSIKSLKFNMVYSKGFEEAISRIKKMPHQKKTESHVIELAFKKLKNNKYSIGYFISELKGIIKVNNQIDYVTARQSLFVNKSKLGKKIKNGNIDLDKPFYENIPNNLKENGIKILLTEKEKEFLKNTKE